MRDHSPSTPNLPTRTFNPEDRTDAALANSIHDWLVDSLEEHGVALLHNVFPVDLLEDCRIAFFKRHQKDLEEPERAKGLQRVGDKRWMKSITVKPPFSDPRLLTPVLITPYLQKALGEELVLNNVGVVSSLPGSQDQHEHRDLPLLFEGMDIDLDMPTYAITLLIPLIDANHQHGSTRLQPGSHRMKDGEASTAPSLVPDVPVGSCILMDYRLRHGGTANLSNVTRPLLYLVYSRPWFRDYRNFRKQPPLKIKRGTLRSMDPSMQRLFLHAHQTWW